MAINYKDGRRREPERAVVGPILAVIAVVGCLFVLGPQSTTALENMVATLLALPRF
jgi:hypothetical protein